MAAPPPPPSKDVKLRPIHSTKIPPKEVRAPAVDRDAYIAWRAATDLRGPYRIDPVYLRNTRRDAGLEAFDVGDTPLVVFINAKSGGRSGPRLAQVLARALGYSQVFDLSENDPARVLRALWANFAEQEAAGNAAAARARSRLRLLVCGGDGTVAWLFKVVRELGLEPPPPVAIMPLGTGNDLSRSFNWGPAFSPGWIAGHASVYKTLKRVADARIGNVDAWDIRVTVPGHGHRMPRTYALSEVGDGAGTSGGGGALDSGDSVPLSPYAARHGHFSSGGGAAPQAPSDGGAAAGGTGGGGSVDGPPDAYAAVVYAGSFFNYFSIGGDAQAAHGFHSLRERAPRAAGSRAANMFWYSWFTCASGWFCNAIPSVSAFSSAEVLGRDGEWRPLAIPASVKALVVVNLRSYGGGRDIWGARMRPEKAAARGFETPAVDDGLVELVGFTHGWQAAAVMATHGKATHAKRLAQGRGIRLVLHGGGGGGGSAPDVAYMQLDGEPWQQRLPADPAAPPVVVEVCHAGAARVLINAAAPGGAHHGGGVHGGGGSSIDEVLPAGKKRAGYLRDSAAGGSSGGRSGGRGSGGGGPELAAVVGPAGDGQSAPATGAAAAKRT